MGNTAKQCRLGLFQDYDFAGDLEDSKSTSGGTLCVFESHTFVPISWMCKKQTSVSHSSTESEIISLDAGLRLDGFPALDLWDLIVAVLVGISLHYLLFFLLSVSVPCACACALCRVVSVLISVTLTTGHVCTLAQDASEKCAQQGSSSHQTGYFALAI